jgi:hypothetical protein
MYGLGGGPSAATPFGVYRPATVPADLVPQYVHVGGTTTQIDSVASVDRPDPTGRALHFPGRVRKDRLGTGP